MEVIGAAASAVTLLGVAVKGTETLYNTISGFKNTSLRTKALSSAIGNLKALLTQLENDNAIAEDTPALKDFRDLLRSYNVAIKQHEKDLQRIESTPPDSKSKQITKKFKGAISGDKDLLRILAELTQCCTTLGTQLNLLQYNTNLTIRNDVRDLHVASSVRAVHDVDQSRLLLEQSANISTFNGKIENVQTSVDGIQEAVTTMTQKLERIPQVSDAQSNDIRNLLLALQDQISGLSKESTGVRNTSHPELIHDVEEDERARKELDLTESIRRLQSLASQKEGNVHGDEADSLVTDLEHILEAVSVSSDNRHTTSQKRKLETYEATEDISAREMKRLYGVVASSHSILLNSGCPRSKPVVNGKISQRRKTKNVTARKYDLMVALTQRTFSDTDNNQNSLTCRSSKVETIARVKVVEQSDSPTILVAYLHRIEMDNGFSSLHPAISIGKMLPDDSSIFAIVRNGEVDALKRLLLERQCTLRDRDSYGAPLLHYALKQPSMCRFLIEHGADVDEMGFSPTFRDGEGPPLGEHIFDLKDDGENFTSIMNCQRLLLEAGADPTIRNFDDQNALEQVVCSSSIVDILRVLLDQGGAFIDLENRDKLGATTLILLAHNCGSGYDVLRVKLLLERGANIHARDYGGRTCLHTAVLMARIPEELEREVEVIVLLINRGADIFTNDNSGRSIFDDVYECDHLSYWVSGGYRGDLWDAALSRCGYRHLLRSSHTRVGHFTKTYTEEHFARLWKGREHECPYFSDSPVLCSEYVKELRQAKRSDEFSESGISEENEDEDEQEGDQDDNAEEETENDEEREDQAGLEERDEVYLTDSEPGLSDDEYSGGVMIMERKVEISREREFGNFVHHVQYIENGDVN